jgi:hypothetical protein
VASGRPSAAAAACAGRATALGTSGVHASAAATVVVTPLAASTHDPTLIGEVTLKSRSMLRKRAGRPRSEMSSAGLTAIPAKAFSHARRARSSLPARPAASASPADAPARPPVKK